MPTPPKNMYNLQKVRKKFTSQKIALPPKKRCQINKLIILVNNGPSQTRPGLTFVFGGLIFKGEGVCITIGVGAIISQKFVFQKIVITFYGNIMLETFWVYIRVPPAW